MRALARHFTVGDHGTLEARPDDGLAVNGSKRKPYIGIEPVLVTVSTKITV